MTLHGLAQSDPTQFDLSTLGLSGVFLVAGGIIIRALWNRIRELQEKVDAVLTAYHTQAETLSVTLDRWLRVMEQHKTTSPVPPDDLLRKVEELLREQKK